MHLKDEHIEYLLRLIDTWNPDVFGKLTWPHVLGRFKKQHGKTPTERTLRNHTRVKERFNKKKSLLRAEGVPNQPKPRSLTRAAQKIHELQSEVDALREENNKLFQRFSIWQKNAMDSGMSKSDLEKPLIVNKDTLRNQ